jgi:Ca-activated chloride channel family protein
VISDLWDRWDPGFLEPVWLLVGLLGIIAVVLLEIGARRRRGQAVRMFAASHLVAALTRSVSPSKRLLKAILMTVAVGLLFVALARPHLFFHWQEEHRSGLDILMAVDCSKSMLTEDVKPNRLERAKLAIADFAARLPDNRLGLIAFAGDAFLQCPLTLDHEAFDTAVRELDTDTIPRPGTDIATAIDQAVDALRSQPANMKFLILITDGEDLEGRVLSAARNAAQNGLKIYTVGVGTPNGGIIPERDDFGTIQYHTDANGQVVQSRLDETTLRQIADITGGAYVPLGQRGEGLDEIYSRYIAPLPKQNLEQRREKIRIERFEWPLGLAILLLMWEFLVNERAKPSAPASLSAGDTVRPPVRRLRTRRTSVSVPVVVAFGLIAAASCNHAHAASIDTAESDYKSGKYQDALDNYRLAAESRPNRNDLQYDLGAAAYKAGEYTEAEEAFREALDTPDLSLQEKTYYNLGNSQFQHGAALQKVDTQKTIDLWEQALHSYDSALKLRTSPDTQHNYEVVKRKLEELKKQQPKQQQQGKNNSSQADQKNQPGQDSQGQPPGQQGASQPQNGTGQNPQNGGQNSSSAMGGGDPSQTQNQPGSNGPQKNGNAPVRTYSGTRAQDQQDPAIKSRQEAENLLDSLKDDERHVTARTLNGDNQPPPTASGKDW